MTKLKVSKTIIDEEDLFVLLRDGVAQGCKIPTLKQAVADAKKIVRSGIADKLEVARIFRVVEVKE